MKMASLPPGFKFFQEMKRIYGICPHCDTPFRLSDATIFTKQRPPKSEFDRLDAEIDRFDRRIAAFELLEEEIREDSRRRGRKDALAHMRKINPYFFSEGIEPSDVRLLFHPVEYVVFRGRCRDVCEEVVFVDHEAQSLERERIQKSLDKAVRHGNMDWITLRIDGDGNLVRHKP
jgi:predicted Holliday junction resolvase-like endonuclease